jgi:hypothetical protein
MKHALRVEEHRDMHIMYILYVPKIFLVDKMVLTLIAYPLPGKVKLSLGLTIEALRHEVLWRLYVETQASLTLELTAAKGPASHSDCFNRASLYPFAGRLSEPYGQLDKL